MATIIIDTRTNEAKKLVDYLRTIKYVKVVENNQSEIENYDIDFIKKLKERENQPNVKSDIENLWK